MATLHNFTARKNPGLSTAFLRTIWLASSTVAIFFNNSAYKLELDAPLASALKKNSGSVKAVCSLQTYANGERVAVCRLHRDSIMDGQPND